MIIEREDNSALYFIVGALLVAVAAFAIYYFSFSGRSDSSPVTGSSTQVENTAPAAGDSSSSSDTMSLSVSPNGATATKQTQQ